MLARRWNKDGGVKRLPVDSTRAVVARVIQARDGLAVSIIALALCCGAVACIAPFSTPVESWLLKRHQVRSGVVGHVALLPYAAMYTFEHELCMGIPQSSLRGPVQDVGCEELVYVDERDHPLLCDELPLRGATTHFPSAKLMAYAGYAKRCDSERMDFVVRSTGWQTTILQRVQLVRAGEDWRWIPQP